MYCVKKSDEIGVQFKHIALNERQWVVQFGLDVHPNNVNPAFLYPTPAPPAQQNKSRSLKRRLRLCLRAGLISIGSSR